MSESCPRIFLKSGSASTYKSNSQSARVITESWVEENMYCPVCGNLRVTHFPANRPVADFYCPHCLSEYELKSKNGNFASKITDGAYKTMMERITSNHNPYLFVMSYSREELTVNHFMVIPKYFFVPSVIEKRKPLSDSARRAGWTGCNILLQNIPSIGKIDIISQQTWRNKTDVMEDVTRASLMETTDLKRRGWLMDVMLCVERIGRQHFTLADMYAFADDLKALHPENNNIEAKIRQQLQMLRDKGLIKFTGRGKYERV